MCIYDAGAMARDRAKSPGGAVQQFLKRADWQWFSGEYRLFWRLSKGRFNVQKSNHDLSIIWTMLRYALG